MDVERLIAFLERKGIASAKEMTAALGVSQPTVSRLISEAGPRVCKMGQTRATRYAATRDVRSLGRSLPLHRIDETGRCHRAGQLDLLAQGRHWDTATSTLFEGLPPFASNMHPQGHMGRAFSACHRDLDLHPCITDWNDDHQLIALARRGGDCVGDLILGTESLDRWFAIRLEPVQREDFAELARRSDEDPGDSFAGGEQPKFLAYSEGRHVLVKFASHDAGEVARRWRDLLVCESLALDVIRQAGLDAARAQWFDEGDYRFLEVERFDRIGVRGRRGLLSLWALKRRYIGASGSRSCWTSLATQLLEQRLIPDEDARRLRWLDVFGDLTANDDRHLGNVSFLTMGQAGFRLAPAYDMLPMAYEPSDTMVDESTFEPHPPTASTFDVWADAASHASAFWTRVQGEAAISKGFRTLARRCGESVDALRERMGPQLGP